MTNLIGGKFYWGMVIVMLLSVRALAHGELLRSEDEALRPAQIAALEDDKFYAEVSEKGGLQLTQVASPEQAKGYPVSREEKIPPAESVTEGEEEDISDPLEGWNRLVFVFNDRFYFRVFKPVAQGYGAVVPEVGRVGVHNFFDNLLMPIRFVNAILQAKPKAAGIELSRFVINSSVGLVGFLDIASMNGLKTHDEDFGQTLGAWGLGHGFFFTWPFLGPSSLRDTFGLAGDYALYPPSYLYLAHPAAPYGVQAFAFTNEGSLRIGEYEALIEAAVDPYAAVRDAYYQLREKEVKE